VAISGSQWFLRAARAAGAREALGKLFNLNELLEVVDRCRQTTE
jgi:hypothetical protein